MGGEGNLITYTRRPVRTWFIGSIFSGLGLVLVLQHEAPTLMGFFFLLIGVFIMLNTPVITVILDRTQNRLVLQKQAVIRQYTQEIPLDKIANLILQPNPRTNQPARMVVILQDGSEFPLTGITSRDKAGDQHQLERMRRFIGLVN